KGPCPPYTTHRRLRTFFQPDTCGHQAINERRFVCLTRYLFRLVPTSSNTRNSQKISNTLANQTRPARSATGPRAGRKRLPGCKGLRSRPKSEERSTSKRK